MLEDFVCEGPSDNRRLLAQRLYGGRVLKLALSLPTAWLICSTYLDLRHDLEGACSGDELSEQL
jgi:hypothetical protein